MAKREPVTKASLHMSALWKEDCTIVYYEMGGKRGATAGSLLPTAWPKYLTLTTLIEV